MITILMESLPFCLFFFCFLTIRTDSSLPLELLLPTLMTETDVGVKFLNSNTENKGMN